MIWWLTSTRNSLAANAWVRRWIASTMLDRLAFVLLPGMVWSLLWLPLAVSQDSVGGFELMLLVAGLPWLFWFFDGPIEDVVVYSALWRLKLRRDVTLASFCEYVGGHPLLPHRRFVYLLLEGSRESPNLTIHLPGGRRTTRNFPMPVLDLTGTRTATADYRSPGAFLIGLRSRLLAGLLRPERMSLTFEFDTYPARRYEVEFTNFFKGNGEIRRWQNHLVAAQAQADTDEAPFGQWQSLPGDRADGANDDDTRDGHDQRPGGGAFRRR